MPLTPFEDYMDPLVKKLSPHGWFDVAKAIMTTDTKPKIAQRQFNLADTNISVSGVAKGAGMIHPNMATMLAYIVCDVAIDADLAKKWHLEFCEKTFNRATVCLLYTSPSPRDQRGSRMPSSA